MNKQTGLEQVYKVLHYARRMEKWILVNDLVKYGLHATLVHHMEDMGHITSKNTSAGKVIKLTLAGYRRAEELLGGEQQ